MENYIYALGDHCDKAIKVSEGEVIEIETRDCFNNQIDSEDYVMDSLDWDAINPATGPYYLENAKEGDVEVIEIETRDCFNNQIDSEDYVMDSLDWDAINPATGPYYLENAKEGDVLKVDILDIQLAPVGTMACLSDNGVLGKDIINTGIKKVHCD